jgi:hypothetical protein
LCVEGARRVGWVVVGPVEEQDGQNTAVLSVFLAQAEGVCGWMMGVVCVKFGV